MASKLLMHPRTYKLYIMIMPQNTTCKLTLSITAIANHCDILDVIRTISIVSTI